jgi:hypothetical protein
MKLIHFKEMGILIKSLVEVRKYPISLNSYICEKSGTMKKIVFLGLTLFVWQLSLVAQFTSGNIVVARLGNGTTVYNGGAAARCFLDEYTPTGTLVQTVAMPVTTVGSNRRFMLNNGLYGGMLTLSGDKRYLLLPGYDADEFTQPLTSITAAIAPRIVARIDFNETINTSTLTGGYDGEAVEAAYSTDGNSIWTVGTAFGNPASGGLRYQTLGSTSSVLLNNNPLLGGYNMQAFNNQLYVSYFTNTTTAIGAAGTGFPTTGTPTLTSLPGIPSSSFLPLGFFMADLNTSVPGPDVIYICNPDLNGTTANTITKYSLVAGTWVQNNSVSVSSPRGLTGSVNGNTVTLFATSSTNLYSLIDASGYNANITATLTNLATAPGNATFKGIAFAPTNFPTSVSELQSSIQQLKVYQRSATNLQVEFTSAKPATASITITDASGKTAASVNYRAVNGTNITSMNIHKLPAGVYFVTISNGTEKTVTKFVKQ